MPRQSGAGDGRGGGPWVAVTAVAVATVAEPWWRVAATRRAPPRATPSRVATATVAAPAVARRGPGPDHSRNPAHRGAGVAAWPRPRGPVDSPAGSSGGAPGRSRRRMWRSGSSTGLSGSIALSDAPEAGLLQRPPRRGVGRDHGARVAAGRRGARRQDRPPSAPIIAVPEPLPYAAGSPNSSRA